MEARSEEFGMEIKRKTNEKNVERIKNYVRTSIRIKEKGNKKTNKNKN